LQAYSFIAKKIIFLLNNVKKLKSLNELKTSLINLQKTGLCLKKKIAKLHRVLVSECSAETTKQYPVI